MNQILTSSADDVGEKSKSNTAVNQTPHLIYDHGVDGEAIIIQGDPNDFPEGSTVHVDEHGNATIYAPQQVQHLADIDDIGDEVEVQNNGKLAWILPMELRSDDLVTRKNNTMKEHLKPSSVLLTNENLRSRPQMFVGAGKTVIDRSKQASQWGDPGDMPGTSSGDGAPGMKSLFRLYADAALRKASHAILLEDGIGADEAETIEPIGDVEDIAPLLNDNSGGDILQDNAEPLGSNSMPVRKQLQHTFQQWPLYWDRPVDYQEACEILTTMRVVPNKKICSTVPQNFRGEGTFVIDLRPLNNRHDAGLDGLGTWGRPTGRNRYYTQDKDGNLIRADDGRGNLLPNTEYVWKCMLKRYEHPATAQFKGGENRFIKKIYTALYPPERREAVALAVVTYEWIGKAFNFRVLPLAQKVRRNNIAVPPDGSKDWEGASFNNADLTSLPATCFGDSPLYAVGAIDFNTAACIILGGLIVDAAKLCARVPQGYRETGTFVIDIRNYLSDAELRRDNNGVWGKPAGHSRYYKIDPNTGDAVRIDRGNKLIDGAEYDIQILSKRYEHPSVGGRFVRKIYTGRSPSGDRFYHTCSHLAVITYYWKGEPEWFEAGPQRRVRINHDIAFRINQADYGDEEHYIQDGDLGQSSRAPDLGMPAIKRPRKLLPRINTSDLNDRDLESVKAMIYKKEYENQERLAGILDRAESFLDRLDRVSMFFQHMPDPEQQIWMSNDPGSTVGHQEEVIMEGGATEHTVYPDGEYVME